MEQSFRRWSRVRLQSGAPWSPSQSQSQSGCVWWCWRCLWRTLFPSGAPGASGDNSERQTARDTQRNCGKACYNQVSDGDQPERAHRRRSAAAVEAFAGGVTDVFFLTLCIYVSWSISSVCDVKLKSIGLRFTLMFNAAELGANCPHLCARLPWRSRSTAPPGRGRS